MATGTSVIPVRVPNDSQKLRTVENVDEASLIAEIESSRLASRWLTDTPIHREKADAEDDHKMVRRMKKEVISAEERGRKQAAAIAAFVAQQLLDWIDWIKLT